MGERVPREVEQFAVFARDGEEKYNLFLYPRNHPQTSESLFNLLPGNNISTGSLVTGQAKFNYSRD